MKAVVQGCEEGADQPLQAGVGARRAADRSATMESREGEHQKAPADGMACAAPWSKLDRTRQRCYDVAVG